MSARKPALSCSATSILEVNETQPPRITSDLIAVIELVTTQLTGHAMSSAANNASICAERAVCTSSMAHVTSRSSRSVGAMLGNSEQVDQALCVDCHNRNLS